MESKAKLLGHPLHPILVTFPLGLLATSVGFDLAGKLLRREDLVQAGYWMAAAGTVSGVAASVPGLIDYLAIPSGTRAKRIGQLHGIGNGVVLSLFLSSLRGRNSESHQTSAASTAASVAGLVLAMATGWLGGELVDRLGVGVDDEANLDAPNSLTAKKIG